jgi:DNA gyrase/topoisomerase IV subunit A
MIHSDDVVAWIAQVRQHPEAAPGIIEALAARLVELDQQNEALRDELVRLSRTREPAADEGRVAALTRRVQTLERQLDREGLSRPEGAPRSLLVLTLDGRGARLTLPDTDVWRKRSDPGVAASHLRPRYLTVVSETDKLLLFTDKGRAVRVNVADVDLAETPLNYLSLLPGMVLELDESVGVVVPFPRTFDRLTLITRKGYARSFRRAEVDSLLERKLPLHSSPMEGDYPAFALFSDGASELLIGTRMGKGVRFPERVVGVQAQPAIKLDRGDVVVGAVVVNDETTVALLGVEGVAARREMAGFGAHATAGNRGKLLTRMGELVAVERVSTDDVLWLLTVSGQLHAIPAARVPSGPGASSGKAVMRLGKDRLVALAVGKGA